MAMVVQNNMGAMNASRMLGVTTSAQAKSSEKLASGYRINRAGDDAAGLKISEKMRSQIRGLQKASTNAQDGISLIQTAEGALNEAHSILQRMNELAVQGANDTNETIDRDAINQELDQLVEELDRISETTQFNKMNLLDGSFKSKNLQVGANADQKISISISNMNAATLGLTSVSKNTYADAQEGEKITAIKYQGLTYQYNADLSVGANKSAAIAQFSAALAKRYTSANYAPVLSGSTIHYNGIVDSTASYGTIASAISADVKAAQSAMSAALTGSFATYCETEDVVAEAAINGSEEGKVSVSDYASANASITAIQEAINKVSSQRSALGAIQNRLEHTVANLDNVAENTQSAESRIRDTDMATEMVEYSKKNILAQVGQSMLAQANQSTQGVLSLLQ